MAHKRQSLNILIRACEEKYFVGFLLCTAANQAVYTVEKLLISNFPCITVIIFVQFCFILSLRFVYRCGIINEII